MVNLAHALLGITIVATVIYFVGEWRMSQRCFGGSKWNKEKPQEAVIVDEMKWVDQAIAEALHGVKETKEREGVNDE